VSCRLRWCIQNQRKRTQCQNLPHRMPLEEWKRKSQWRIWLNSMRKGSLTIACDWSSARTLIFHLRLSCFFLEFSVMMTSFLKILPDYAWKVKESNDNGNPNLRRKKILINWITNLDWFYNNLTKSCNFKYLIMTFVVFYLRVKPNFTCTRNSMIMIQETLQKREHYPLPLSCFCFISEWTEILLSETQSWFRNNN